MRDPRGGHSRGAIAKDFAGERQTPLEFPARSGERPGKNVIALSSPRRFTPINLRNSSPESRPLRADLLPEYPPFRSFCAAYKLPFLATRLLFSFPPVGPPIVSAPPRELSLSDGTEPAGFPRAKFARPRGQAKETAPARSIGTGRFPPAFRVASPYTHVHLRPFDPCVPATTPSSPDAPQRRPKVDGDERAATSKEERGKLLWTDE